MLVKGYRSPNLGNFGADQMVIELNETLLQRLKTVNKPSPLQKKTGKSKEAWMCKIRENEKRIADNLKNIGFVQVISM